LTGTEAIIFTFFPSNNVEELHVISRLKKHKYKELDREPNPNTNTHPQMVPLQEKRIATKVTEGLTKDHQLWA
jgi:hypothetical protein